jgi:hypothetical protein
MPQANMTRRKNDEFCNVNMNILIRSYNFLQLRADLHIAIEMN